jgi:hypothetical protein
MEDCSRSAQSASERRSSMDDQQIHGRIEQLVSEEHELWNRESEGTASEDDRRRLDAVKVTLDQCWDLLRQRRALREAGMDEDVAQARDPRTVERYQQ